MLLVIALAAAAVLAAVVVLAMGRGGELAEARPDRPPMLLPWDRPIEGADVAMVRLPQGLWGYHIGATNGVLIRLAQTLGERDTRIAVLEWQLAELRAGRVGLEGQGQVETPEVSWEPAHQPQNPWSLPAGPLSADLPHADAPPAGPPPQFGDGPGQVVFGPYGMSDYQGADHWRSDHRGHDR
jgi:hypothetical protein